MNMTFINDFLDFLDTGQTPLTETDKNSLDLLTELSCVKTIDLKLLGLLQNITFSELLSGIPEEVKETTELFKDVQFPYSSFIKNYIIYLDKVPSTRGRYAYI